jgi:putative membrane protein
MEKKLWWIITTPAMILTIIFGISMFFYTEKSYLIYQNWMHIKLIFVFLLILYHFLCQKIFLDLKNNIFKWSSQNLRIWNEIATLFLVSIVFIVTSKGTMNWWKGILGFIGIAIVLMLLIKLYKRFR